MQKQMWQPFGPQQKPKLEEFLFGDPKGRHIVISALDRSGAVWRFHTEANSVKDYVPEKYFLTDTEGRWMGSYDVHAEMFIHQYTPDARVPVFVRDRGEWKEIEGIPFETGR